MPRSKDPRNYGPIYQKLVELMDKGQTEIRLKMGPKEAFTMRHTFYAYVNAMSHELRRIQRDKSIPDERKAHLCRLWARHEDVARGYIVFLEEIDPETTVLRFVHRSIDERFQGVEAQLDEQLEANPNPSFDEIEEAFRHPENLHPGVVAPDGRKVVDEWRRLAGDSFRLEDIDTAGTTQEDIDALSKDPPVRDDLSDLITGGNQADPPQDPMTEALRAADKLREKEKQNQKESKKTT